MKIVRAAFTLLLSLTLASGGVLAASLFAPNPAYAVSGTCRFSGDYHVFGQQYTSGSYYGQYGYLYTYNVSVPDPAYAFSLSHLYTYYGNADPYYATAFVEVGYYKGLGTPGHYVTTPHYYWTMASPTTGYVEHDSSSGPSTGSTVVYEVEFRGHNYTLGTDDWNVYWNGLGSSQGTAHQPSMPNGSPMAGGEVQGDGSSLTQMETHGIAHQQVILSSYTWQDWTTSFSTSACNSPGITFTENSKYMDYSATGQA